MSLKNENTVMIQFRNVTKYYPPNTYAVRDINLTINTGEFVSIVGQSGMGKTTLVKLIIAEEHPTKGRVVIGGWDITNIRRVDVSLLRRQIGVVFQDFKLLSRKTVAENVAFALQVAGTPHKRVHEITQQVLSIVGLDRQSDRFPHQLSGGEQQRVSIARALVHRPKILVADEPTGNLDTINTHEIIDLLLKINALGTTVVLVTHNREVVNSLKKRVVTLDKGMLVSDKQVGRYVI